MPCFRNSACFFLFWQQMLKVGVGSTLFSEGSQDQRVLDVEGMRISKGPNMLGSSMNIFYARTPQPPPRPSPQTKKYLSCIWHPLWVAWLCHHSPHCNSWEAITIANASSASHADAAPDDDHSAPGIQASATYRACGQVESLRSCYGDSSCSSGSLAKLEVSLLVGIRSTSGIPSLGSRNF